MIPALTWFTSSVWAQASGREDRTVPFPPARRVTGICAQLPNRTLELCPVLENRGKRSRTMPILPQFNQRTPRSIVSSLVFFFFSFFWQSVLRDTRSTIFDAGVFVCRHQVANPTEEDYYHDNPNFTFSFIYGPGNSGA